MNPEQLCENRNYSIVKSNYLIQKVRYDLTTQEQKIILYSISKLKPEDKDFQEYEFDLKDLCQVCGIEMSGANYQRFRETITNLGKKVLWIETETTETMCHWVNEVEIDKEKLSVKITLSKALKPYLLRLKDNFTIYSLESILLMKSKHSIRIYEILQSYTNLGEMTIPIEKLQKILNVNYGRYNNFKSRVLNQAISEINELTDITVSLEPVKVGKTVVALHFIIQKKDNFDYTKTRIYRAGILNKTIEPGGKKKNE